MGTGWESKKGGKGKGQTGMRKIGIEGRAGKRGGKNGT